MATSSKDAGGDSVYAAIIRLISQLCRRLHRYLTRRWAEYQEQRRERKLAAAGQDAQTELLGNSTEITEMKMQNMHESSNENHSDRRQSTGFKSNGSTKRKFYMSVDYFSAFRDTTLTARHYRKQPGALGRG
jgi:DNA topoisomerase VI subunit B